MIMKNVVRNMLIALFLPYIIKFRGGYLEIESMIIFLPFAHWHNLALTC